MSRARLVAVERQLQNHHVRHRMSRFLYHMCIARSRGEIRPVHELEEGVLSLPGASIGKTHNDIVLNLLKKMKAEGSLEEEEEFVVNPPYTPTESVSVLSWDYARALSIPHKAHERMSEHFANVLGYNVYLFGLVD